MADTYTNGNGNGHEPARSSGDDPYVVYAALPAEKRFSAKPVPVEFPSGMVALLRPLGLELLVKSGRVPDFLTPLVIDAMNGREPATPVVDEVKQAEDFVRFLDLLCELAFVMPRVVSEPKGEDEISADDIPLGDKYRVFEALGKPRWWLEAFRPEPLGSMGLVEDQSGVSHDTEPVVEAKAAAESGTPV